VFQAPVAQRIEQQPSNLSVPGSNPGGGARSLLGNGHARGSNLAQGIQDKNAELFMRYRGSRSVGEAGGSTIAQEFFADTAESAQVARLRSVGG
jgi:hypothetical protein